MSGDMDSLEQRIDQAAARLERAAATRVPCAPVRDLIGSDVDSAYQVQSRNIASLTKEGRRVIGRKIGLTSPTVQEQLGVDQPDFGVLLDDSDCSNSVVDMGRLLQPRIEAEVAFALVADIDEPVTAQSVQAFVSRVFAAFEIVDSRISGWDISLADTVADNASAGLFVLGESIARADTPDLSKILMKMSVDGNVVSTGAGADCLGSPWNALAWLANTCLSYGAPLRAGEIILSGALGPMVSVSAASSYTAEISGVGTVSAEFVA